jgi:ketosteroid isomerase-like protein
MIKKLVRLLTDEKLKVKNVLTISKINNLYMKLILIIFTLILISCSPPVDKEALKKEIFNVEKSFEKMAADSGIAKAFYFYAADSAVIKRENDTLITGRENIRNYYNKTDDKNTSVNWTAEFIDISDCGTMAYTYGNYVWKIRDKKGKENEYKGVFHTIWKKHNDKTWKYVWD